MTKRNEALQAFADASFVAFDKYARDAKARQSIDAIFAALQSPSMRSSTRRSAGMREVR